MKITVLGLWHLGSVTAACCARHFQVTGLDFDAAIVGGLQGGKAPILEPGLDGLLGEGLSRGVLAFTTDAAEACAEAEILWLCQDTPVDADDISDVSSVIAQLERALPHLAAGAVVLISSQLPVGTCAGLEVRYPQFHFACCPENLRLGKALEVFNQADRYVVGTRDERPRPLLETLLRPFSEQIVFMRTESAEMVKHAINSFLAVSVTFINEIARVCEWVGADAAEVSRGLKTDIRIGSKAYLGPGGPFAGGTLARDVVTLTGLAAERGETLEVIPAIKASNDRHRNWAFQRLHRHFGELTGKRIALLGLTYKQGTDTLRRSSAVELGEALLMAGCVVTSFDPVITHLPRGLAGLHLKSSIAEALHGVDAAVVCTEWPEFRQADWRVLLDAMLGRVVVDANRFLDGTLKTLDGITFLSVGRL